MNCEYVRQTYNVPAQIGRVVEVYGQTGIITEDRGHYIGVNFDSSKPNVVKNCHPTDGVTYLGIAEIRKPSRSQQRYSRYLKVADLFDSFLDFCRYDGAKNKL